MVHSSSEAALTLKDSASRLSPAEWHDVLCRRIDDPTFMLGEHEVPGFPDLEIQMRLNGRPAKQSMGDAFALYEYAMDGFRREGLSAEGATYLDFGAGGDASGATSCAIFPLIAALHLT